MRGGLKVRAEADSATADPEVFAAIGEVEIRGQPFRVREAGRLKHQVILHLEGIDTLERARGDETEDYQQVKRRIHELTRDLPELREILDNMMDAGIQAQKA